jgi:hypothetical protein
MLDKYLFIQSKMSARHVLMKKTNKIKKRSNLQNKTKTKEENKEPREVFSANKIV